MSPCESHKGCAFSIPSNASEKMAEAESLAEGMMLVATEVVLNMPLGHGAQYKRGPVAMWDTFDHVAHYNEYPSHRQTLLSEPIASDSEEEDQPAGS